MTKFVVRCAFPVYMSIEVDADDKESAIDAANDFMSLSSFCGNGGTDKLIGTAEPNVSLEPGDYALEGDGWGITVEEAGD